MFKSALAAVAAVPFISTAALAGPYVNVETNAGYTGTDYDSAVTDLHVGYEGDLGESAGYYVQAGPALVAVDGEDTTTELSGKVGISTSVTSSVDVYGEYWAMTSDNSTDDLASNVKAGIKWNF